MTATMGSESKNSDLVVCQGGGIAPTHCKPEAFVLGACGGAKATERRLVGYGSRSDKQHGHQPSTRLKPSLSTMKGTNMTRTMRPSAIAMTSRKLSTTSMARKDFSIELAAGGNATK